MTVFVLFNLLLDIVFALCNVELWFNQLRVGSLEVLLQHKAGFSKLQAIELFWMDSKHLGKQGVCKDDAMLSLIADFQVVLCWKDIVCIAKLGFPFCLEVFVR